VLHRGLFKSPPPWRCLKFGVARVIVPTEDEKEKDYKEKPAKEKKEKKEKKKKKKNSTPSVP